MTEKFTLQPRRWYGWIEMPMRSSGWAGSPIYVTAIKPLKTGAGLLQLEFIQPMRPICGERRVIVLRTLQHSGRHLAASCEDGDVARTALVSEIDDAWLETFCPLLLERRPPRHPTWIIDGESLPGLTAQEYLADEFRSTEDEILHGARSTSFDVKLRRMPKQSATFDLDTLYDPFDSWLIGRGCVPRQMEDKWFIFLKGEKLFFHRSWTGILIYQIDTFWDGDCLHLGRVTVNRNRAQYGETDTEYDAALLRYLIDAVLRGCPGSFPVKPGDEEVAPLQARSVAGKASLTG